MVPIDCMLTVFHCTLIFFLIYTNYTSVAASDVAVNRKILMIKLEYYGIRGPLIWFTDYLTNRYQQIRCNGATSSFQAITCGVPQRSNLGPLLFILYINDLPNVCKFFKLILFADDTNAFYFHESKVDLISIVNEELQHMKDWFCANRLSLNLEKTNFIAFQTPQKN